jgi:uncharacterized protein (DUF58 family)
MNLRLGDVPRLSQSGSLELMARRIVEGMYAGKHRSPYTGPAVEFADHRAYMPGDDLRSVDWKAFARSDHLLIRRYREERDLPLVLVLDTSASMAYGEPSKHAWTSLAAATLALLAIDQGDRVRLVSGAANIDRLTQEYSGAPGANALMSVLGALAWTGRSDLPALLRALLSRLHRRALVVVVSDLLCDAESLSKPVGSLSARGHDVAVIQVLDATECSLPETWSQTVFEDPEGATPPITTDAAVVKRHFDAAMQAHVQRCRKIITACQADHVLATTNVEVAQILGHWLHARRRR